MLNQKKFFGGLLFIYLAFQIYFPKVTLGAISVYPLEVLMIGIWFLLFLQSKIKFSLSIEYSYLFYTTLVVFALLRGNISMNQFDIASTMIVIKYTLYILLISITYYLKETIDESYVKKIFYFQIAFFLLFGSYVLYSTIAYPVSITTLSGSYFQHYRLIGYTGYSFGTDGLKQIGTTSVSMGVYASLLFLILLVFYKYDGSAILFFLTISMLVCLLLTYSRAGILSLLPGFLFFSITNFKNLNILRFLLTIGLIITILLANVGFSNAINYLGTLGKLITYFEAEQFGERVSVRTIYWGIGLDYISSNPFTLLWGIGYGSKISMYITGISFFESFIFQTLMELGFLGIVAVFFHFFTIYYNAKILIRTDKPDFFQKILIGINLFLPGFILANCVAANILQTDFVAPIFYFLLAISIFKSRENLQTDLSSSIKR